jgi:hypothetical protein
MSEYMLLVLLIATLITSSVGIVGGLWAVNTTLNKILAALSEDKIVRLRLIDIEQARRRARTEIENRGR